jgi:hypothetical protein
MGGVPVVILIGFLILWVIINVVKAQQDEAKNTRRPPNSNINPPPNANRPADRNTANDIDRFLQEIDRLRQRSAQPKSEEERPTSTKSSTTTTQQKPKTQTQRPQTQTTARTQTQTQRPQTRTEPVRQTPPPPPTPTIPTLLQERTPVAAVIQAAPPPSPIVADLKFMETATTSADGSGGGSIVGTTPAQRPVPKKNPIVELIRALMKSKDGRAVAVVMKEILDRSSRGRR